MRGDARQFDALVERFTKLGRADREAVLANLTRDERDLFERERAGAREEKCRERDRARLADRQFVGYSPWLAAAIGSAAKNGDAASTRTSTCNEAIVLAHRATSEPPADGGPLGRFLRQLGIPGLDPAVDQTR